MSELLVELKYLSSIVCCNREVLSIEEIRAISQTKKENYHKPKKFGGIVVLNSG